MNHKKLIKPTQLNYICTEMAYFMVTVFIRYVFLYAKDILLFIRPKKIHFLKIRNK